MKIEIVLSHQCLMGGLSVGGGEITQGEVT